SAGFVGMFLGAAIAGRLADRVGRKMVFQVTLVVFSFGALLSAVAPSFETLLLARVIAGLGLGGELPVASTLVSEYAPRASRRRGSAHHRGEAGRARAVRRRRRLDRRALRAALCPTNADALDPLVRHHPHVLRDLHLPAVAPRGPRPVGRPEQRVLLHLVAGP